MRLLTSPPCRLGAVALLVATGAAAHPSPQGPLAERGTWALGFALPSSEGSSFSLWRVRSPETALGLEGAFYWALNDRDLEVWSDRQSHRLRLQLRPTFKRYLPLRSRVAPYVYYQAVGGFYGVKSEDGANEVTTSRAELGVGVGLGVDWFPFQRVGIGGRTGLDLSYRFGESSTSSLLGRVDGHPSTDRDLSLSTLRSDLTALVYF